MVIREAKKKDLTAIVAMLADDKLGQEREDYQVPLPEPYLQAFESITMDSNHELMVIENDYEEIIATMQLSFLPYLTYRGGVRAQIEAVRVRKDQRGKGLGRKLIDWAIERAQSRRSHVLQLTTDKKRPEAIAFYQELGFTASHEGMKMHF